VVTAQAPHRRWAFVHIPKTAGQTFNAVLSEQVSGSFRVISPAECANFPDLWADTKVVSGHVPVFVFDALPTRRHLLTILRDPVERVISNYRFILARPDHYAHEYVHRHRLSLGQCYDHPVLGIEFTDFQTKMIGWVARTRVACPAHGPGEAEAFAAELAHFSAGTVTRATLGNAIRRLSTDISFGVLDEPRSLSVLCREVSGSAPAQMPFLNATSAEIYEVTDPERDAIGEHNVLDAELYRWAKAELAVRSSFAGHLLERLRPRRTK